MQLPAALHAACAAAPHGMPAMICPHLPSGLSSSISCLTRTEHTLTKEISTAHLFHGSHYVSLHWHCCWRHTPAFARCVWSQWWAARRGQQVEDHHLQQPQPPAPQMVAFLAEKDSAAQQLLTNMQLKDLTIKNRKLCATLSLLHLLWQPNWCCYSC